MRYIFAFILSVALVSLTFSQDRQLSTRRTFQAPPSLATLWDTDFAAGIAQTPYGYALPLSSGDPIPASSNVGLFGHFFLNNGANKVLLWSNSVVIAVDAQAMTYPYPGLEMILFRLPENVHGEVWVTVAGRQVSNTARIIVE